MPTVKAVWLLFVNVMVVTSIAVFFSAFSSPFLSGFFALGCFVVGRSVPDIRALGEKLGPGAKAMLESFLQPDAESAPLLSVGRHRRRRGSVRAPPVRRAPTTSSRPRATESAYSLVVLVLAMLIFRKRDFV